MSSRPDVIVIGYGPTGMALSALLAQSGHDVVVLERFDGLFNLPRAATFDDETMRLFQKLGIADEVMRGTRVQVEYDWCNAEGRVLIRHLFAERGVSGWPQGLMMFQPRLEECLDRLCRGTGRIRVLGGHRVTGVEQDERQATVTAVTAAGNSRAFSAPYVIACDGGNSTVRELLGIALDDLGFRQPWLVCDFELKRAVDLPNAQQLGDPEQPTSIVSIGLDHHRFSFMIDDPKAAGEVSAEEVWRKVSRWIGPDDAELIRIAPYVFDSRVAVTWGRGRIFLAGDAAHQMPPFLGQGMCSGIRDAHNLAWKLDLVLSGRSDESLLSTYQPERAPHVRGITLKAVELGRIQTIRDVAAAAARDAELLSGDSMNVRPAAFVSPAYENGFLSSRGADAARGELFPQAVVRSEDGARQRLDDLAGPGFVLIVTDPSVLAGATAADWAGAGVPILSPATATGPRTDGVTPVADIDGIYEAWFRERNCVAVLVRPDRYVFGSAGDRGQLAVLLDEFSARVHHHEDRATAEHPASI
ncbi:bifunctional 3-(3-hydroxy-phenyl)propionate/3-hydroxycinnamic acid hydroxylase [Nocardia sienata]|uniref:bifunctional 3-(3-hydroxy-phenyl)propionate/3-hydroxycinnamic acid hydroxylase n=1 Tax=Nocardia sienata TaxID=248552 RepID=UPI0007A4C0D3|nr:bifunctional 3-(3-hydroxy-phenyl)propionate/3-hydroxycinnamic acid hydroxylase [Nocardia sienata]